MKNVEEISNQILKKVEKEVWLRIKDHLNINVFRERNFIEIKIPIAVLKKEGVQMQIVSKGEHNLPSKSLLLEARLLDQAILEKLHKFVCKKFIKEILHSDLSFPMPFMTYQKTEKEHVFKIQVLKNFLTPSYKNYLPPRGKRGQLRKVHTLILPSEMVPMVYEMVYQVVKKGNEPFSSEQELFYGVRDKRQLRHIKLEKEKNKWKLTRIDEIKKACTEFGVSFSEKKLKELGELKHSAIALHIVGRMLHISPTTLKRILFQSRKALLESEKK